MREPHRVLKEVNSWFLYLLPWAAIPTSGLSALEVQDLFHIPTIWVIVGTLILVLYVGIVTVLCNKVGNFWLFVAFFQLLAAVVFLSYINGLWFFFPVASVGKWEGFQRSNTARFDWARTSLLLDGDEGGGTFKTVTTLSDNSQALESGRWQKGTGFLNSLSLAADSHRTLIFKRRGNYLIWEISTKNGVKINVYLHKQPPAGPLAPPWLVYPYW